MLKCAEITINGRKISSNHPPFIIAELSANHNGSLENAFVLLEKAKKAGAHAIKLQTYRPDTITIDCDAPEFRIQSGEWKGNTLYSLYEKAYTPWEWHSPIFEKAKELGLTAFSSPFDQTAVDFLEKLEVPAYKIASFELIDLPLIRKCAATGKPLVISTGMGSLDEIQQAIDAATDAGATNIALLHCTSGYPTPYEEADLLTIQHLSTTFGRVIGISDHTLGIGVPIGAVTLGASIVEKHLTLNRADGGPDSAFSIEPEDLSQLCRNVDIAWRAVGKVRYSRAKSEQANVKFRRSLYAVADISAGERLKLENVRSIRPGYGIAPKYLDIILGKKVNRDVARGTPITWDVIG